MGTFIVFALIFGFTIYMIKKVGKVQIRVLMTHLQAMITIRPMVVQAVIVDLILVDAMVVVETN